MNFSEQMEMGTPIDATALKNNLVFGFQILKEAAKANSRGPNQIYRRIKR